MMHVIALMAQHGGAGTTTRARHRAVAAQIQHQEAAVIDLDPQASATSWGNSREADTPVVVSAQAARLPQVLDAAKAEGAKLVFIDTAPHSESAARAATRAADLVLIPCRPAIRDLRAIGTTIDLAQLANTPAQVVLNAVPARGNLAHDAAEAIGTYGVAIAPHHLGQRAAFQHALTLGLTAQEYESRGKAAEEIQALATWTQQQI